MCVCSGLSASYDHDEYADDDYHKCEDNDDDDDDDNTDDNDDDADDDNDDNDGDDYDSCSDKVNFAYVFALK